MEMFSRKHHKYYFSFTIFEKVNNKAKGVHGKSTNSQLFHSDQIIYIYIYIVTIRSTLITLKLYDLYFTLLIFKCCVYV